MDHSHFLSSQQSVRLSLSDKFNKTVSFLVLVTFVAKSFRTTELAGTSPLCGSDCQDSSVFQEFLARLLRFLLSEVKPGRGDHFSFLARLFHKLAGGAKPRLRLFPNQGIVTTSHLTASHLIPFQPDSLHLDQVGLHLHWLHCTQPVVGCTLHSQPAGTLSFLSRRGPAADWTKCAAARAGKVTRRLF